MALLGFKRQLVENSVDAFVLSLETINRLTVRYRIQSFCMLLCNAWELLLKAKLIEEQGRTAIYKPKERGKPLRTWSGKECSEKLFKENDPVRRNLEAAFDLRNESVHLVIANLPSDVLELLQSCVLNYHNSLIKWFGLSLADRVPVGMMAFVYDLSPLQRDIRMIRKDLGAEEVKFLTEFQARIEHESQLLGYSQEFVARIEHKVVLVNRKGQADVSLAKGESGHPIRIVEKPRDPAKTHPLRTMKLVNEVQERTNPSPEFTEYLFRSVRHVWGVREGHEWFYCSEMDNSSPQYSQALADKIVDAIAQDPGFLEDCKSQFKAYQNALSRK